MKFKSYLTLSIVVVGCLSLSSLSFATSGDYEIITNNEVHAAQVGNAQVSNWAREGVGSMKYDSVIDGYTDKTFRTKNQATRQEAIKIVAELAAKKGFITINHPVTPTNPQPQNPVTSKPAG